MAQAIPDYHAACEKADTAAQQEQLRWICAAMARLLGQRLQNHEKWSRWRWVDDVLPFAVMGHSSVECEVRGLAIWGEDGSTIQYFEPFAGSVRVDEKGELVAYQFQFADAAMGLGEMSVKDRRAVEASLTAPAEWRFTFLLTDGTAAAGRVKGL